MRYLLSIFCILLSLTASSTGIHGKVVAQPIVDYSISLRGSYESTPPINAFEDFTHFASDYGWMGPGQNRIFSERGEVGVRSGGKWTGAWHSLAGLATNSSRSLDPHNILGLSFEGIDTTIVTGLSVQAMGSGSVRLELANTERRVVWSQSLELCETMTQTTIPLDAATLGEIKFINWVIEPDSSAQMRSLGFQVEVPDISVEEWAFRISLGKLRRCHDVISGLTRDRGHLPAGEFDSIPSTGFHALASALAVTEGLLNRAEVEAEIHTTLEAITLLPKAYGFLPHFTHRDSGGGIGIHPGTEYSTVDTAIAFHCLLLATQVLGMEVEMAQTVGLIQALDFDAVTDAEGYVIHGFTADGVTPLSSKWKDWGGESALVLALEAMQLNRQPVARMDNSGEVFRGVGFIGEMQSLFYPDFDSSKPDKFGVVWSRSREKLLQSQRAYFSTHWPESAAARMGLYGLSAGEAGLPGEGYTANGVEMVGVTVIHPHYLMLSSALSNPSRYAAALEGLDLAGLLMPTGLPEVIEVDLNWHNPMQGSINAGFESVAAYHGMIANAGANRIYAAARELELFRSAVKRFYQ